jgi:hypothetical protein
LKLKEGEGESMALHEPWLETPSLAGIYKAFEKFNRNTTWVATGLLGSVAFAALMVALQERHTRPDDLTKEARQTTADLVVNANPAAISDVVGSNEKSTGETTSGQASVNPGFTPEISDPHVQAKATLWSPAHGPDSAQVIRPKIPKVRRYLDVKTQMPAPSMAKRVHAQLYPNSEKPAVG